MSLMNFISPRFLKNETQRYALFGGLFGLTFPIVGTLFEILFNQLPLTLTSFVEVQIAEPVLWIVDTAPFVLGFFSALAGLRQDRLQQVNDQLNIREKELQSMQLTLEERVSERTQELEQASHQAETRASRLQAITEISESIAFTRNPLDLMPLIARSISEKLGFYHTGVFLLDEARAYAVLRAANSDGGQKMLARGHRLKAGSASLVGYVAQSGRPRLALDTGTEAIFFNNPDLPTTRSEIALPLKVGNDVIGVLDVQSEQPSAFKPEDVDTLSALANQVAIVIQNARLLNQAQSALETYTQIGRRNWRELVEKKAPGYTYLPDGTLTTIPSEYAERIQTVLASDQTVVLNPAESGTTSILAIPVKVRDQVIGILHIEARDPARRWSDDEIALVESISERAAFALENARLFEETARRAEQERIVSQITSRIGESSDFERIMQTTIRELGRTLGTTRAFIQLEIPSSTNGDPAPQQSTVE